MPLSPKTREIVKRGFKSDHMKHMVHNYPQAYTTMKEKGEWDDYLEGVSETATQRYEHLEDQMEEKAKTIEDPKEQEAYRNQISLIAGNIVDQEIIYIAL